MDKAYQPAGEEKIYQLWEEHQAFTPTVPSSPSSARRHREPFVIILPPPNANDPLHAGHALYTVEDIMVRFHRMLGDPTLWLPGTDHAGIETQFVFEKYLQKEGKSRFDYDRSTLYQLISDYVSEKQGIAISQMKRLGFSLDWSRLKFTLDEDHTHRVYAVFRKMVEEGLVYRGEKIVNYCTRCGTAFSNLEVNYQEEVTKLYYLKYGPFTLATTRPETKFGDTAVAVNPKDPRYRQYVGQEITVEGLIGPFNVKVIADDMVDPKFGTGVVKITPAHDPDDFEAGLRHGLPIKKVIGLDGRLNELTGKYAGLKVAQAREQVVADMAQKGMIVKVDDNYVHRIGRCYRCNSVIEPMVTPQWFVKVDPLARPAVKAVEEDRVKIFPKRFKKTFLTWMANIKDWPISRQIIWGHRIPAWYVLDGTPQAVVSFVDQDKQIQSGFWKDLKGKFSFDLIKSGLQSLTVPADTKFYLSENEANEHGQYVLQETDTFDTWFSSGQWPYSTLGWSPDGRHSPDFEYFYPTTVLDTMWDILFFWVARMIMMGIYVTGQVPFRVAHMHSRVLDGKGQKMSKSKGNVINPIDIVNNYGADALRLALVIGVAPGSDIALSDDKVRSQRNFINKIWNASRFVLFHLDQFVVDNPQNITSLSPANFQKSQLKSKEDKEIIDKLDKLICSVTKNFNSYHFGLASESLYQFFWHDFCDLYLESVKSRSQEALPVLVYVLITSLKLLHPFAPYVTETIYQILGPKLNLEPLLLAKSPWPSPAP